MQYQSLSHLIYTCEDLSFEGIARENVHAHSWFVIQKSIHQLMDVWDFLDARIKGIYRLAFEPCNTAHAMDFYHEVLRL